MCFIFSVIEEMLYIKTLIPFGWWGNQIQIEIDSNKGLPWIDIIWLADNAIKESKERLRAAFRHCGIDIPPHRFVINLAPSDIKKSWTICDVAIATGLLVHIAQEHIPIHVQNILENCLVFGELGLDGTIRGTQWVFAGVLAGMKLGFNTFIIPKECEWQCMYFENIQVFVVEHFSEIMHFCLGKTGLVKAVQQKFDGNTGSNPRADWEKKPSTILSFDDIQWHLVAKRALAIAVAWMHNVLLVGPPWWWKSMLAKATKELLPAMNFDEIIDVTYLYSLAWMLTPEQPLIITRPFRKIHSTSSKASIIWWGANAQPWEISLAHKWVLFLDEIGEFPRDLLDTLRQPLEDREIHISRVRWKVTYPAECMFIGATNPCICGYYGDPYHTCRCPIASIKKYQSKMSGPLLDRMDIVLQIENQEWWAVLDNSRSQGSIDSATVIREKVQCALEIQHTRYKNAPYKTNAHVPVKDLRERMKLSDECEKLLQLAIHKLHYSLRVVHKTIKLARTIADYDNVASIEKRHILEALGYRAQNRMIRE